MCGSKSGRSSRPIVSGRKAKALVVLSLVLCLGLSPLLAWSQWAKPSKDEPIKTVVVSHPQEQKQSPVQTQTVYSPSIPDTMIPATSSETMTNSSYSGASPLSTNSSNEDVADLNELQSIINALEYNNKLKDTMFSNLQNDTATLQAEYDALAQDYASLANKPKAKEHRTTIMPKAAYRISDGSWGVGLDLTHRIGYVSLGVGATYFPVDGLDKTIVTGGVGVSF